jgi:hypothetical protein
MSEKIKAVLSDLRKLQNYFTKFNLSIVVGSVKGLALV